MNAEEQINADELCRWNVLVEYGNCSEWKYKFASFSMLSKNNKKMFSEHKNCIQAKKSFNGISYVHKMFLW